MFAFARTVPVQADQAHQDYALFGARLPLGQPSPLEQARIPIPAFAVLAPLVGQVSLCLFLMDARDQAEILHPGNVCHVQPRKQCRHWLCYVVSPSLVTEKRPLLTILFLFYKVILHRHASLLPEPRHLILASASHSGPKRSNHSKRYQDS